MSKKTKNTFIRLPEALRKIITQRARENMRTESQELNYLIELGLHVTKFKPHFYDLQEIGQNCSDLPGESNE